MAEGKPMKKPSFNLKINLIDVPPTSSITKYPNISEGEKELLGWAIVGDVCISCDNILLSQGIDSGPNCIATDYVWYFLTDLHTKIPDLLKGKRVEQTFYDNPDTLTFVPEERFVNIVFECKCKNHEPKKECKATLEDVLSALLQATKKLEGELLKLNPFLETSDELRILKKSYTDTLSLISKHG